MPANFKIIFPILGATIFGLAIGWVVTHQRLKLVTRERDSSRLSEGVGWLFQAKVTEKRHPDTRLFAARAIGFVEHGKPEASAGARDGETEGKRDGENLVPLIQKTQHQEAFNRAAEWIQSQPAYQPVWSGNLGGKLSHLAVSTNGRYVIAAGKEASKKWDLSSPGAETALPGGMVVAIHPGGERFAIANAGEVVIFEKNAEIARYPGIFSALAYNATGDQLAAAREDGALVLLGEKTTTLGKVEGRVGHLAFDPSDSLLAATVTGVGVRIWFYGDQISHPFWANHTGEVTALAFDPDPSSGRLAIGDSLGKVSLWQVFDGTKVAESAADEHHQGAITCLGYQGKGGRLISGGMDGQLRLWNTGKGTPELAAILNGHQGEVRSVSFLPGGELAASAAANGVARLWDLRADGKATDMYSYLKEGWFSLNPEDRSLTPLSGSGFINLPPNSLVGAWQAGRASEWSDRLIKSGEYVAAGLLGGDSAPIQTALGGAVDAALRSGHHQLARLRSRQLGLLGLEGRKIPDNVAEGANFANAEGIEMLWCKPGTFTMGEADGPDFAKRHKVTLSRGFWLGKYELTQAQFQSVMGNNPSRHQKSGPKAPAENFTWHQASDFCRKLTVLERIRGRIPRGWEYSIPTEAQWEYACRAGTESIWSFGGETAKLHQFANFDDKRGKFSADTDETQDDHHQFTAPVGSYAANPWQFHDMHGNVFEWCRDAMDPVDPNYPEGDQTDPLSTRGDLRVVRGGAYDGTGAECRSAYRDATQPMVPSENLGLRVALVPMIQ